MDSIQVQNQERVNRLLNIIESLKSEDVKVEVSYNNEDFYKILCFDQSNNRCPFSLWINKVTGEKLFFNIGDKDREATVFHYHSIETDDSIEEVINGLNFFLQSRITMIEMYCNNRLKRIDYRLQSKGQSVKYSHLKESYLFCFKKESKQSVYERWL